MSKWIKKDLFDSFRKEKIEEKENPTSGNYNRSSLLWQTPDRGTVEQAKVYEGRFVPDPEGEFYKRYYYHFWKSGESWKFVLCPKTYDFKNYCPVCSAVSKLYNGTRDDKKQAYQLKRKEKFVANFYIARDNRDEDRDEEKRVVGKIKLYEFPSKVEQKLKNEITDNEQGYGDQIFDPSENGRNFIIKVLSTKKDDKGNQWPDYSSSTFSRTQEALGNESEIDALMETCTSLTGYIDSMDMSKEQIVEILKSEFLWDLVQTECSEKGYLDYEEEGNSRQDKEPEREEPEREEPEREEPEREESQETEAENVDVDGLDDDDLLAELDKM